MSRERYSPLYVTYEASHIRGLQPPPEVATAATDTFWPAILGEMGVIGLIAYRLHGGPGLDAVVG